MVFGRGPKVNVETGSSIGIGWAVYHPLSRTASGPRTGPLRGLDFIRALALIQKWSLQVLVTTPGKSAAQSIRTPRASEACAVIMNYDWIHLTYNGNKHKNTAPADHKCPKNTDRENGISLTKELKRGTQGDS